MSIEEICISIKKEEFINCTLSNSSDDIIDPNDLDKTKKHLIIFDDIVCDSNKKIVEDYFIRGRHSNVNCIYLTQSWFKTQKNCIRDNINFLILFKTNEKNSNAIFRHIIDLDIDRRENLLEYCKSLSYNLWKNKYSSNKYKDMNKFINFEF